MNSQNNSNEEIPSELHENEQRFFNDQTKEWIIDLIAQHPKIGAMQKVALLCCPSLSLIPALSDKENIRFFDIDNRFPAITYFDIGHPKYQGEFDVVICDPPFFTISLTQLHEAMKILFNHRYHEKWLLISYLTRRENKLLHGFRDFNLRKICPAQYVSVEDCERNEIYFYSNIPESVKLRENMSKNDEQRT